MQRTTINHIDDDFKTVYILYVQTIGGRKMIDKYFFSTCLYFTANRLARVMNKMAEEAFATTGLSLRMHL